MKLAIVLCIQICLLLVKSRAQDSNEFHSDEFQSNEFPSGGFGDDPDSDHVRFRDPCPRRCKVFNECNGCPPECLCPLQENVGAPQCGFRTGCEFKPPCRGCEPQCICGGFINPSLCDSGCELFEQCIGCEAQCKCPADFERGHPIGSSNPNPNGSK